ncbi:Inositolphosphorylceramide synthase subunit Kei1-domain-containing protein [Lipomyces oligophaga]|uniref:Inositolphosphorylceramide synthase subunit Kei1-domain-containing protein n=1 Tax=Lipomyces oligophaga TaxID=45792 RepID=UPI0034CE745B
MISITPRKYFMGFLPLAAGAELIAVFGIVNKASGLYGLLSIFTGHPISGEQWALNIISIILLPFFLYALHCVRRQMALPVAAFAYVYFLDMLANIAFTIYFSVTWFRAFDAEVDKTVAKGGAQLDTASERGVSISIITIALLFKVYASLVLFGFARMLVQKEGLRPDNGQGKAAKLQFILLSIARPFWTRDSRRAGKGRMMSALEEGLY